MKFDSYSRFLKSSLYQECVHAELDGRSLPDPYQIPCSPAPSKHSASSDRSTLSTPKKVQTAVFGDCEQKLFRFHMIAFILNMKIKKLKYN